MTITASKLRQDIYRLLDGVADTGEPLMIKRKDAILKIVSETKRENRLARLKKRPLLLCDPEDIVHLDWSSEWRR